MSNGSSHNNSEFNQYAGDYDSALARGISISGEDKNFFARRRIEWLRECLLELEEMPRQIMDFGCGIGSATPFLSNVIGYDHLIGVDTSEQSLAIARRMYGSLNARFATFSDYPPDGQIDLAFCNGVFHHIPPSERAQAISYVFRSLRPDGLFAVWENNPFNPGTRFVMSRIPFDRDAIPVTPRQLGRLLVSGGFDLVRRDFFFIFPKVFRWFRGIEPYLSRYPLGAQYQFLCRKSTHV